MEAVQLLAWVRKHALSHGDTLESSTAMPDGLSLPALLGSPLPAELYDLQDPEGVAQTTVSLLSEKSPERRLQEFLDHKIAGIRAVVDALQVGWEAVQVDQSLMRHG
jgi:hypothetical protein